MKDGLNERQPQRKTTLMEYDFNGRRPQWKTTQWKLALMEDNINGK